MRFLFGFGLVIEDVKITVANLDEVYMTRDDVALEAEVESVLPVVGDVFTGEEDGDLHGDRHGIVDQHEALQGFVPFLIRR